MYKAYAELTENEKAKIKEAGIYKLRDVTDTDFIKVKNTKAIRECNLKNLINIVDKIEGFPSYTVLIDTNGVIHIVYIGKAPTKYQIVELDAYLNVFFNISLKTA